MNINPKIITALDGIGCPVSPIKHDGSEDTYIVFYTYLEALELFADDEDVGEVTYGTVMIYSKDNFKALAKEVKNRLKQAGFIVRSSGPEGYEPETGYYSYPIEIYVEETEG
jgi:hypothetical protein